MIPRERVRVLNNRPPRAGGRYVLYWMQAAQRSRCNHALEYAIRAADERGLPVVVGFGLTDRFPGASRRPYAFMLQGLADTAAALRRRGILLAARRGNPPDVAVELGRDAALVVTDMGYLALQRRWRSDAAARLECPLIQVETNVVVPVEAASSKEAYAARSLRPGIRRCRDAFLQPLDERSPKKSSAGSDIEGLDLSDPDALLATIDADPSVGPSPYYRGGESEAARLLDLFISTKLDRYDAMRNDPNADATSHMSPYLHFGQISPVEIALRVRGAGGPGAEAYLEELIVRRELGCNYAHFNPGYETFAALPAWAKQTLARHEPDAREYTYTARELEAGRTHDPYWNAAQKEMALTGKMHGYMRMYWGKKILEWRRRPADAFRIALDLNDRYELDGRDPSGYANVAWCFGKHDRPWGERPVFGTVRSMSDRGLRRKFDADAYVRRIEALEAGGEGRPGS